MAQYESKTKWPFGGSFWENMDYTYNGCVTVGKLCVFEWQSSLEYLDHTHTPTCCTAWEANILEVIMMKWDSRHKRLSLILLFFSGIGYWNDRCNHVHITIRDFILTTLAWYSLHSSLVLEMYFISPKASFADPSTSTQELDWHSFR